MAPVQAQKIINFGRFLLTRTAVLLAAAALLSAGLVNYSTMRIKMLNRVVPASVEDLALFFLNPDKASPPNWDKYILYFRTAAKVMPGFSAPNAMMGYCYFYKGDLAKAAGYYRLARAQTPTFFWFHYNLGVIYYRQGRYEEAAAVLKKAVSCRPEDAIVFINVSKIYRDLNRAATDAGYDPEEGLVEGYRNAQQMILACTNHLQHLLQNDFSVRIF